MSESSARLAPLTVGVLTIAILLSPLADRGAGVKIVEAS
jgi:hypothetical protein